MKQKMIKKLKYEDVKDRCYINYVTKKAILWKTKEKNEVELIMDVTDFKTLIKMIIF